MSEWITDRRPTIDDVPPSCDVVFDSQGRVVFSGLIAEGEPWMPITPPEPYVKPKRWRVTAATGGYIVYDSTTSSEVADSIPTREAAKRIAAIYEEVMP